MKIVAIEMNPHAELFLVIKKGDTERQLRVPDDTRTLKYLQLPIRMNVPMTVDALILLLMENRSITGLFFQSQLEWFWATLATSPGNLNELPMPIPQEPLFNWVFRCLNGLMFFDKSTPGSISTADLSDEIELAYAMEQGLV